MKGVTALVNNREGTYFLITVKEEEMLRQIRELSEADRKEIQRRFLEIAVFFVSSAVSQPFFFRPFIFSIHFFSINLRLPKDIVSVCGNIMQ